MNENQSDKIVNGRWHRMPAIFGYATCLATLSGFAGQFSWLLDLCSHFRLQYLVILTICSILCLALRQHRTAVIFLVFAGMNLATVLPLYIATGDRPPEGTPTIRVLLLNVNTRQGDFFKVRRLIADKNPDLVILEEVSDLWLAGLKSINASYPYSISRPREDNFGIALFSRFPLDGKVVDFEPGGVPSIVATVVIEKKRLQVIATHPLPPIGRLYSEHRNNQLALLPSYISASLPVILAGDLNTTPWNYYFKKLLRQSGLKDSSRGYGIQPTWPNNNPLLRIPIDHLLHSSDIRIVDRYTGGDVSSDHYPVIVDLWISDQK